MQERKPNQIMIELVESLTQAIGGASQIVHHHRDPRFIPVTDALRAVKDAVIETVIVPSKTVVI